MVRISDLKFIPDFRFSLERAIHSLSFNEDVAAKRSLEMLDYFQEKSKKGKKVQLVKFADKQSYELLIPYSSRCSEKTKLGRALQVYVHVTEKIFEGWTVAFTDKDNNSPVAKNKSLEIPNMQRFYSVL